MIATFRPYRRKVTLVAVMIVVTSGLGVVNPLLKARVPLMAASFHAMGTAGISNARSQ